MRVVRWCREMTAGRSPWAATICEKFSPTVCSSRAGSEGPLARACVSKPRRVCASSWRGHHVDRGLINLRMFGTWQRVSGSSVFVRSYCMANSVQARSRRRNETAPKQGHQVSCLDPTALSWSSVLVLGEPGCGMQDAGCRVQDVGCE